MFTSIACFVLLFIELSTASKIYLHPPLSDVYLKTQRIQPKQARLLLAHHFGLEQFDYLHDSDESLYNVFQQADFIGEGVGNAFILNVDAGIARDLIPPSLETSFSVSDKSSQKLDISSVSSSFLERARRVYASVSSSADSPLHSVPRLLDVFTADPSYGTEKFLAEAAALVSFVESNDFDSFGVFELSGLSEMIRQSGRKNEQYKMAVETVQGIIMMAMSKPKMRFAVLSGPMGAALDKRAPQPPQSPLPPSIPSPAPQQPIGSISTCFTSEDVCTNTTSSCSGHGSCTEATKAGKSCFVCACNVTMDSMGRRQWWAGEACQRKDISGPFVLIAGTTIAIILLFVGSVWLLQGLGEQKLPPSLANTSGGHLKRD